MRATAFAEHVLSGSGLAALMRRASRSNCLIALNYHRIGEPARSGLDVGVFSATAEQFEQQVQMLRSDFDLILPQDLPELPRRGPGSYAMITFDDGYRDNYDVAFPILKKTGVQAVFFVATGFIDRPHLAWWDEIAWMVHHSDEDRIEGNDLLPNALSLHPLDQDRTIERLLQVYKRLPYEQGEEFLEALGEQTGAGRSPVAAAANLWMNWEMLQEMQESGMVIGAHTVHHPILACLPPERQQQEISGSIQAIEGHLGGPVRYFSYPRGKPDAFNEHTKAALRAANVQYAFSYYGGANRCGALDPLDIRRMAVDSDRTMDHFEAMVTLPELFA